MVSQELTAEIKMILHNLRIAGCTISRKTAIVVKTGGLHPKSLEVLLKNRCSIKLINKWDCGILKSTEWSKCRGTSRKREINPALYEELIFSCKKDITNLVLQHNIPEELILNLDQTPLPLVSASKVTMAPTGSHTVSIIDLGFSYFNGFQRSNFTIHIGYKVASDRIL